jgi:hypothetical protein
MNYTTCFSDDQLDEICETIQPVDPMPQKPCGRKQLLSLRAKVAVTVSYLRTNRTEADLACQWQVDQSTISRVLCAYTPAVARALEHLVPTVEDLDPAEQLVVDGTLAPTWSWADHPEDYSGKHKTTGANLQVAVGLGGRLRWVSDPVPGSTHDAAALRTSGLLDLPDPPEHIGDKGYQGVLPITPVKRRPGQEHLRDDQKEYNRQIGAIRFWVEQAIANLKTWRVLHTDYRRPRHTHPDTITAVLGLHFYRTHYA